MQTAALPAPLWQALNASPDQRAFVLATERLLLDLLETPHPKALVFGPFEGMQRRLVHFICDRYIIPTESNRGSHQGGKGVSSGSPSNSPRDGPSSSRNRVRKPASITEVSASNGTATSGGGPERVAVFTKMPEGFVPAFLRKNLPPGQHPQHLATGLQQVVAASSSSSSPAVSGSSSETTAKNKKTQLATAASTEERRPHCSPSTSPALSQRGIVT